MSEESRSQAPGDAAAAAAAGYNEEYLGAPGVRFVPTDQDLIVHYLQRKLRGERLPTDLVVDGHDAYAEHPEKLVAKLGEGVEGAWYLFSPRDRKYAGGMRPQRDTGDGEGHWKAVEAEKQVLGAGGKEVIGAKRGLTFHGHSSQVDALGKRRRVKSESKPTRWKMVEFVSSNSCRAARDGAAPDPMLLNDCVLCKITYRLLRAARRAPARGKVEEENGDGNAEEEPAPGGGGGDGESQENPLPEQQAAGGGGAGAQGEQQQTPPSSPNQQPATAEAPSGGQMSALPDDAYRGAQYFVGGVNGSNRSGTNKLSVFDSDDHTGAAYGGGESLRARRAGYQQAASGGGAGAGSSPDGQQQPTPEASNGGGGPAANGAASEQAVPYLYDWEAANPSDWELYDSALASADFAST